MKIGIIGTGGVGGYLGGKMARAGYDVTFIARGEHLKSLQSNGLIVKSILGDFILNKVNATNNIGDLKDSDLLLICVKAWQVKEVALQIKSVINKDTIVIPIQNGISAIEELKEQIPPGNCMGGLCRIFSKIESPGIINHFGIEPIVEFGEIDGKPTERISKVKELFNHSGITSIVSKDIVADIWKKFIVNCASGLLAVTKSTYGQIREIKETRQLLKELFTEIYDISQKAGINIEPDFVAKTISLIDTYPYEATSSLTRDIWAGNPSEIEYQNGKVVQLGEKYDIATPINRIVYYCILPMELKARKNRIG
jgi:2-dehydropantoate 2-reductase